MPEPRTGGFNGALDLAAAYLAACPTWTTIGGTDIILEERDADPPATAHAFVSLGDPESFQRQDPEVFLGALVVQIDVLWPPAAGLSKADARSRANSQAWSLWSEFAAACGLHVRVCDPSPPIRLEESAAPAGWYETTITLAIPAGNL
jgi:hypothetical protein